MGKLLPALVLALLLSVARAGPAQADTGIIRVGLSAGLAAARVEVLQGAYDLVDPATGAALSLASAGSSWTITPAETGLTVTGSTGGDAPLTAGKILFRSRNEPAATPLLSLGGKPYRGDLRVEPWSGGGLLAVNILDVEEYLYGVVGEEIGYRAPAEALKAQAVVSRTFALSRCASQSAAPFDLGAGQSYQVYAGFAAENKAGFEQVKAAVDSTRGQVIYYRGKLIQAYYHANAGGYTENSENVWQQALPYLRGVSSPWDEYALRYRPQSPDGWPAYSYHWDITMTRTELARRLADWNAAHAGQPDQIIEVGEVIALVPSQVGAGGNRSVSGRVTTLTLVGSSGEKELRGETARILLGLRSTLFTLRPDSQVFLLGAGGQPQERQEGGTLQALYGQGAYGPLNRGAATYWVLGSGGIKREVPKIFSTLSFSGYGHGHGLGMSQWGAWGMAVSGYAYRDILEYYYNQNKHDGSLQIVPYTRN